MINPHVVAQINRQRAKWLSEIHKARIGASNEDGSDSSDSEESLENAKPRKKKELSVNAVSRSQTSNVVKGEHNVLIGSRTRKSLVGSGRR